MTDMASDTMGSAATATNQTRGRDGEERLLTKGSGQEDEVGSATTEALVAEVIGSAEIRKQSRRRRGTWRPAAMKRKKTTTWTMATASC